MESGKASAHSTYCTLLRGKLVECYVEIDTETKKSANSVKDELAKRLRLCRDPLEAAEIIYIISGGRTVVYGAFATGTRESDGVCNELEEVVPAGVHTLKKVSRLAFSFNQR